MKLFPEIIAEANVINPVYCPSAADWARTERELKVKLPGDYKELISSLGEGLFGCGIQLLNPMSPGAFNVLGAGRLLEYRSMFSTMQNQNVKFWPASPGLLRIGGTGTSVGLYFAFADRSASPETVLLHHDHEEVINTRYSISEFIWKLFKNEIEEDWADSLRGFIYPDDEMPFFVSKGK